MKKPNKTQVNTKTFTSKVGTFTLNRKSLLIFVTGFALVGAALILATKAAVPVAGIEPESKTVTSPAIVGNDSNASGGKYIQFKAPSTGGGTTPKYFSASSPWNTKIPANATFVNAQISSLGWFINYDTYSHPVYISKSTDPLINVNVPASWGWPAGTIQIHAPAGIAGSQGTDGSLVIIDGTTTYDFWIFQQIDATHFKVSAWAKNDIVTGTGWGTLSPFLAAGIRGGGSSGLAGQIMGNELTTGINHALAIATPGTLVPCPAAGYVLPAISGDGSCEGVRVGIPPGVARPSGLSTPGIMVWNALQTYGGYIADTVGGGASIINADPRSVPASDLGPLYNDLYIIGPYVKAIN